MERMKRSKTSVFKILAQAKNLLLGVVPLNKKHTGRSKLTTKGTDALIKREVIKNPRLTAVELKNFIPKNTRRTVKHTVHVMVWGCFSGKQGRGTLYFLPKNETMNSERYIRYLEQKLLDPIEIHQSTFFM